MAGKKIKPDPPGIPPARRVRTSSPPRRPAPGPYPFTAPPVSPEIT